MDNNPLCVWIQSKLAQTHLAYKHSHPTVSSLPPMGAVKHHTFTQHCNVENSHLFLTAHTYTHTNTSLSQVNVDGQLSVFIHLLFKLAIYI